MFSSYNKINIFLFNINIFHLIQMKKALIIFGHTFGSFCHSGRSRGTVQSVSVLPWAADSHGACTAPGARRAVKRQVSGRTATAANGELRGKTPFDQGKETALLRVKSPEVTETRSRGDSPGDSRGYA